MLGIVVQLVISWLIIWFVEKGNLSVLGFYPTKQRLLDFVLFLLIAAACCSSAFFMRMYWGKEQWDLNPDLTTTLVSKGVWWHLKSVLFEELIFRGVLLYLLIKKLGALKGIIISAIAFGIYHWFSHEVIGHPAQMAVTFLTTGIMGLLYAYGYAKTFSLYVPVAIHYGWNFTKGFIFSEGPIGNGIFVQTGVAPIVKVSYFVYFCVFYLPLLTTLIINFLLLKRRKQSLPDKS